MPVDATPIPVSSTATESTGGTTVDVLTPEVSTAFDENLLKKMRAIVVRQNSTVYLRMTIVGSDGNPVDLTNYGIASDGGSSSSSSSSSSTGSGTAHVEVRYREAVNPCATYAVTASVPDAANGLIQASIPLGTSTAPRVADQPGIFIAEAGIINDDDELLYTDTCYVYVESSGWDASDAKHKGPPAIDDLRLSVRDNDFFENELLENYGYGHVELCHAAIRAVRFWNDSPPPIGTYSTITYPFREIWIVGTQLFLFDMAEEWYRRNFFKQSAGGVTIDDMNRHKEYKAAWQERFQRFSMMVKHQKASMNMQRGFGQFGSGYNWNWYW